ncbi:MAG TPA: C-terminal binding protein [Caldilineaceae bacterium]|nr:C-terminal binding protein [Caldilineaceae bacterium]
MPAYYVLVTDYAWLTLDIERRLLAEVDAAVLVAPPDKDGMLALAPQTDAILTCWRQVPTDLLDAAPRCRIVSRYGIGLDNIPVEHATRLGIVVTNVPDFCLEEVADHTLALLLACARRVVQFAAATRQGIWNLQAGRPMPRLRGQLLGLVGFGNIARTVAQKAHALGLAVAAYTPRLTPAAAPPYVTVVNDLHTLLAQSDYVSLHVPLTPATRGLIDAHALRAMKPSAYLINTARGAVVDEAALLQALREGWIAGAALDVLSQEPPPPDHPLLGLENVIATPHAAFYSESAIADLQEKAARHVRQALQGQTPDHVVNRTVLAQANCRLGTR